MGSRLQHKQKRAALEANITALCKKFKFHEVAEHVLPIFRNVTLERILRTIKKNKKTVTSERIGQVLVEEKKDEPYAFLEDMYFELYLKLIKEGPVRIVAFCSSGPQSVKTESLLEHSVDKLSCPSQDVKFGTLSARGTIVAPSMRLKTSTAVVKNFIARVQNYATLHESREIHDRADAIKIHALVHNQLSAPVFQDKIVHSINYTWYAFKMLQSEGKAVLVTAMQISEALKDSFRSLHPAPRIKVQLYGAFTWIMIVQKKKKVSGEELVQKYIFAYTPGEQYIFASQKNIKTDIADGLLFTFGYKKLNDCNLSASDIKSMVILLMNKAAKAFDAHSAQHTAAPYAPGPGVVTENGMDFTDQHLKQNYANMIFGKDCPAVKKLTVKEEGQMVRNKQMYRSSFTIVSNNVYELLKGLFVRGVIVIPLSPYIERLLTLGKNYIIIRPINESLSQKEQQN